jgi:hypothetical protein
MKTRLMTNQNQTSFRLDVIEKNDVKKFYFNNKNKALQFQKKITNQ